MCAVKACEKQAAESRRQFFRVRSCEAVSFVNKCEAAFATEFVEPRGDFTQHRLVDLGQTPAGRTQFVEDAQEIVGIPCD